MAGSSRRLPLALAVLAAVVLVLLMLLLVSSRPGGQPARGGTVVATAEGSPVAAGRVQPAVAESAAAANTEPTPAEAPVEMMASGQPFWRPGQPHWYGPKADPFIRQPHDYPTGTPAKLGNRISQHLFDLERVQDMVSRGGDVSSEIAQVRGRPLDDGELARGRAVMQQFFDETIPVVDAVLSDEMSRDAAYAAIGPRRWRMNQDLRAALGLTEAQFAELWPHIPELAASLDQLRD